MSAQQPFPHPLADPLVDVIAERFRVLAEPTRIKLLDRLREGDATVGELQAALGASQQNISKHLGILHTAGMVTRTKDGNHARYSIADPSVFALCATSAPRKWGTRYVSAPTRPPAAGSSFILLGACTRAPVRDRGVSPGPPRADELIGATSLSPTTVPPDRALDIEPNGGSDRCC